jgi:hypothetical protein
MEAKEDVKIPGPNFVVTERYWSHVSNQTGLPKRYGTSVISALEELPQLLRSQGCLGG